MNTQLIELADAYATLTADPAAITKARQTLLDALEARDREIEAEKLFSKQALESVEEVGKQRDTLSAELAAIRAQEPVAYVKFKSGDVDFATDDNIVISNVPGDCMDETVEWRPVYAAPVASPDVGVLVEAADSLLMHVIDKGEGRRSTCLPQDVAKLRAALTQSQAARVPDAMAKDAARYQKLRDTDLAKLYCDWVDELLSSPETTSPEDFDAAIDAAPGKGGV